MKNDFEKFNCKTYMVILGLKIHLLVMGVIKKPINIVLLYKYRNFVSVRKDSSIKNKYVQVFYYLFIVLIC